MKFIAVETTRNSALKDTNKIRLAVNGVDLSGFTSLDHISWMCLITATNFVTSPDIFMHSFAMTTSLLQPTGTLNCSRVASFKIMSQTLPIQDDVYACSLNILKYENGMCGILYAN